MEEEELLRLNVKYDQTDKRTTVGEMKADGFRQVKEYLHVVQNGMSKGGAGVYDHRVECIEGTAKLLGYVVIAIGGQRVLAWKVVEQECERSFRVLALSQA